MAGPGPVAARQDKPHPHAVVPDPTGQFLLAPDLGADLLRLFSVDPATGALTSCANVKTGPGDGPRHAAWWAPSGGGGENGNVTSGNGRRRQRQQQPPPPAQPQMLFVVNELGNSVSGWKVSYPGGCLGLAHTQTLATYAAGQRAPAGAKAAEVHVAGDFVYVVNRNDQSFGATQDSVATFRVDAGTGQLAFVEATSAYTYYPRTFQINKAGDLVAWGGQTSSTVAIVPRNPTTGRLGPVITSLLVGTPGTPGNEDGLSAVIWVE